MKLTVTDVESCLVSARLWKGVDEIFSARATDWCAGMCLRV